MKKVLYGMAGAITVGLIAIYAYAFSLPAQWTVEHERAVSASPADAYALLGDLKAWPEWSSWGPQSDETATWAFSDKTAGEGARAEWNGEKLGEGRLVVTRAVEPTRVEYDLWFAGREEPSNGVITLTETESGTTILWVDRGTVDGNPLLRLLLPQVERQLSDDIERSLIRIDDQL